MAREVHVHCVRATEVKRITRRGRDSSQSKQITQIERERAGGAREGMVQSRECIGISKSSRAFSAAEAGLRPSNLLRL